MGIFDEMTEEERTPEAVFLRAYLDAHGRRLLYVGPASDGRHNVIEVREETSELVGGIFETEDLGDPYLSRIFVRPTPGCYSFTDIDGNADREHLALMMRSSDTLIRSLHDEVDNCVKTNRRSYSITCNTGPCSPFPGPNEQYWRSFCDLHIHVPYRPEKSCCLVANTRHAFTNRFGKYFKQRIMDTWGGVIVRVGSARSRREPVHGSTTTTASGYTIHTSLQRPQYRKVPAPWDPFVSGITVFFPLPDTPRKLVWETRRSNFANSKGVFKLYPKPVSVDEMRAMSDITRFLKNYDPERDTDKPDKWLSAYVPGRGAQE